jgi:heterogeneous nuclear rnp K-like protein
MGTIIGRQGLKIKHIQDASGVRMVAQKEMLPQSTERIVEVQGGPEGIQKAVWEICKCLIDDWQRGTGTVLYNPVVRTQPASPGGMGQGGMGGNGRGDYNNARVMRTGNGADFSEGTPRTYNRRSDSDAAQRGPPTHDENGEELQTQNISIPSDMVGCIIGRAGSKISEIRKTSGARISIAKGNPDSISPFWKRCVANDSQLHMMIPESECSLSWAVLKLTRLHYTSSTRTSRLRKCDEAKALPKTRHVSV